MKYSEIVNEVKELYPSEYEDSQIIKWLQEAEAAVSIFKEEEPQDITDLDIESKAQKPYDRMYIDFICAHISLHQHDDASYARYIEMYNARFVDYCKWYIRTHRGKEHRFRNWI